MNYFDLKRKFENNSHPDKAQQMTAYMRNQFEFYGLQSKERKELYHDELIAEKEKKKIDWNTLNLAWQDSHREMQYFVCDYLIRMQDFLKYTDLKQIEKFVLTKSWWDTIDSLIKPVGKLSLVDSRVGNLMLAWAQSDNIWKRRFSIEYQLLLKDKTDTEILTKIIELNLNSDEFFINKAIGWILRDYSKTNAQWVRNFIKSHNQSLNNLSIKEASKYLN